MFLLDWFDFFVDLIAVFSLFDLSFTLVEYDGWLVLLVAAVLFGLGLLFVLVLVMLGGLFAGC